MAELLAPAGDFESLKAAVEAGADAVYLAGKKFGARAYAENFSDENMVQAVKFAHLRNVAVHVTVNTLIADEEISDFTRYIEFLCQANVDAILVQDLGAADLVKKIAPKMPLHASTQMTIHNLEGVLMLAEMGFTRVVLSRELSLEEIEYISKNSPIETEIFIHGALCVCYSGQCLMSSMIGGRSGNRGRCAQPCRLPYTLVDSDGNDVLKNSAGEYLLSPKDLNTLNILPKILSTGVTSLKIEGRMKRPEYVATVVKIYRDAINRYENNGFFSAATEENKKLAQIFNRDFTTAYLEKNPGKNLISDKRPNNRGILVGRVTKIEQNKLTIKLAEKVDAGDQIEIWVKKGGRKNFTIKKISFNKEFCVIEVDDTHGIKIHDRVFKIFDAQLTAEARKFFKSEAPVKKIDVTAKVYATNAKPLTLVMTDEDGNSSEVKTNFCAEIAKNTPLTLDILQRQISKLGNTIFNLKDITAEIDSNLMMPLSEINEVRRKAVESLEKQRLAKFDKNFSIPILKSGESFNSYHAKSIELIAQVDTLDKLNIAIENGADAILYGGENFCNRIVKVEEILKALNITHAMGKNFYLATPRIIRQKELDELKFLLTASNFDAIYVHNLGTLRLVKKLTNVPIHSDFSLAVFNSLTINFLKNLGLKCVTLSPELTLEQIKKLINKSNLPVECIVHGYTELMISSYCALGGFLGKINGEKCSHICKNNIFYLKDRKNILFPVKTDQFCRMHILNSKVLSMIEHRKNFENVAKIRADCRSLSVRETEKIIHIYKFGGNEITNFTRGHYFRGITSI